MRNISYVSDCVEALVLAALNPGSDGQVFFAVADRQCSVAEIAQAIVRSVGGRVRSIEWPREREVIEIGDAVISNARIKRVLQWAPQTSLEDGLVQTRAYYLPCLPAYLR
jgi:nucleoside-diphosphate-sugar epimerase